MGIFSFLLHILSISQEILWQRLAQKNEAGVVKVVGHSDLHLGLISLLKISRYFISSNDYISQVNRLITFLGKAELPGSWLSADYNYPSEPIIDHSSYADVWVSKLAVSPRKKRCLLAL